MMNLLYATVVLLLVTMSAAQEGKKVSSSFVATRGKKNQFTDAELDGQSCFGGNCVEDYISYPDKRVNMGFQGVRGKKASELLKRAMGFMGTRGKKYHSHPYGEGFTNLDGYWVLANEFAKRKFYGMRGKKIPYISNAVDVRGKKGPSATAFLGMRGKKQNPTVDNEGFPGYDAPDNLSRMMYLLNIASVADNDYNREDGRDMEAFENDNSSYGEQNTNE